MPKAKDVPKIQVTFKADIDLDDTDKKLHSKGIATIRGGGRPEKSGESPEAGINFDLPNSETSFNLWKTRIQAYIPMNPEPQWKPAFDFLKDFFGFTDAQTVERMCHVKWPSNFALEEKKKMMVYIHKLEGENEALRERLRARQIIHPIDYDQAKKIIEENKSES